MVIGQTGSGVILHRSRTISDIIFRSIFLWFVDNYRNELGNIDRWYLPGVYENQFSVDSVRAKLQEW